MSPSEFVYTVILRPKPLRKLANAAIRAVLPRKVTVEGAGISINPDDPVVSGGLTFGVYEREEIAFFRRHFQPDMTLVDVGANVGLYTGMALATPDFHGRILCVEPDTESRSFLQANIDGNLGKSPPDRVSVCACAASDQNGPIPFFRNPENHGDNRLYADPLLKPSGTVEARTLDSLCAERKIDHIDFLKIDVQGAEAKAIVGGRQIISASPKVVLMTEFWPEGLRRCGSDPGDYLDLLTDLGFALSDSSGQVLDAPARARLLEKTVGRQYTNLFGFKGSSD